MCKGALIGKKKNPNKNKTYLSKAQRMAFEPDLYNYGNNPNLLISSR